MPSAPTHSDARSDLLKLLSSEISLSSAFSSRKLRSYTPMSLDHSLTAMTLSISSQILTRLSVGMCSPDVTG